MGRVRAPIRVEGRDCWTLFDTGSRNTYVVDTVAASLPRVRLHVAYRVGLGGQSRLLEETCVLQGEIEGRPIDVDAYVLENLGPDESGRPIEVLFGALAMQKWGIRPIPDEERLDLTNYSREFIEFAGT